MPPAIDPSIRKQVIRQYLNGVGRNQIARDLNLGQGTVTGIIETLKQGIEGSDPDYQARDLAIHCRKEGFGSMADYREALRIKNYLARLGPNINEENIESFIASLVNSSAPSKQPRRYRNRAYLLKN
jgi:hypothetical protein